VIRHVIPSDKIANLSVSVKNIVSRGGQPITPD
jgi:hypothetical protein